MRVYAVLPGELLVSVLFADVFADALEAPVLLLARYGGTMTNPPPLKTATKERPSDEDLFVTDRASTTFIRVQDT